MNFTIAYVMAALGTIAVLFWCLLFIMFNSKYDNIICAIDRKKFMLSEIFSLDSA